MKIKIQRSRQGIALIIVMVVVLVFGIMAGLFAYSMKVETKLARNSTQDTELEWLGRSGIELAKCFLSQSGAGGQQYDGLNQKWAGGTGETNDALAALSLENNELGRGKFSVKIIDLDRKFNINVAGEEVLRQAMILIGTDAAQTPLIVNAILDWRDADDDTHVGSTETESDYYLTRQPPHSAKNGPIDDMSELLMIKGITPGMYWGSGGVSAGRSQTHKKGVLHSQDESAYPVGFVDLFTTLSSRFININTASATTLQMIPDIDENMAHAIISTRAGPDGVDGNDDDMPFRSIGEMANVPGINRANAGLFARYFTTRSSTFEVEVNTQMDLYSRTYVAVLRRNGRELQTLYMFWK